MLILKLRPNEEIVLSRGAETIAVLRLPPRPGQPGVQVGFEAPPEVKLWRRPRTEAPAKDRRQKEVVA